MLDGVTGKRHTRLGFKLNQLVVILQDSNIGAGATRPKVL